MVATHGPLHSSRVRACQQEAGVPGLAVGVSCSACIRQHRKHTRAPCSLLGPVYGPACPAPSSLDAPQLRPKV